MVMLSDEDILNLPDDPELAFVELERHLRSKLNSEIDESQGNSAGLMYAAYVNYVTASAKALGLKYFDEWKVPINAQVDYAVFSRVTSMVDHITIQTRIRNARRTREYSVLLDPASKQKVRHHLTKVKEIVDRLEISDAKRESLYQKISALELEINRDRTRFDAIGALLIESATAVGKAAEQLEPVRKIVDSIAGVFGKAKESERNDPLRLPKPEEPKKIESKTRQDNRSTPHSSDEEPAP